MNKVCLVGRLSKDPDLKFTAGEKSTAICRFSVAVNRIKKGEADFINCVAFGKTGETIANYLTKGSQIGITGRIQTGSYTDQSGNKKYTTDVMIESFDFVGGKSEGGNNQQQNSWEDPNTLIPADSDMPF